MRKELSFFLGGLDEGDQPLDFLDWLKKQGQPVPEGMTQAEAAAEFLRQAAKFGPFLASLREAIATGTPWDFGPRPGILDRKARAVQISAWNAFTTGQRLLAALAQARMRTGQPDEALALWSDLRQAARHSDDAPERDSFVPSGIPHHELVATARAGLALGAWRDADLAQVSADLAALDCLDSYRKSVSRRRDSMAAAIAECRADRETLLKALNVRFTEYDNVNRRIRKSAQLANACLASDTQLTANLAVIDQQMQLNDERFDYTRRVYLPPRMKKPPC